MKRSQHLAGDEVNRHILRIFMLCSCRNTISQAALAESRRARLEPCCAVCLTEHYRFEHTRMAHLVEVIAKAVEQVEYERKVWPVLVMEREIEMSFV